MNNPFYPTRISPETSSEFVARYFIPRPSRFWRELNEEANHFIIGTPGMGKTILLRRLDVETQFKAPPETKHYVSPYILGVHILLGAELKVILSHLEKVQVEEWTEEHKTLFKHYFSLALIHHFCRKLSLACEEEYSNFNGNFEKQTEDILFELNWWKGVRNLKDISFQAWLEMNKLLQNKGESLKDRESPFTPVYVSKTLADILREVSHKTKLWWLLDELEGISVEAQQVVFTLLEQGYGYFTKIATRPYGIFVPFRTADGLILERGRHFKVLPLIYTEEERAEVKRLLEEVGNERLKRVQKPSISSIRSLLDVEEIQPIKEFEEVKNSYLNKKEEIEGSSLSEKQRKKKIGEIEEERKEKIGSLYFGFECFSTISGLNIGTFLELCANAWNSAEKDPSFSETGKIDKRYQNEAVGWVSDQIFEIIEAHDTRRGPYLDSIVNFLCDEVSCRVWTPKERAQGNIIYIEPKQASLFGLSLKPEIEEKIREGFRYGIFHFLKWNGECLDYLPSEGFAINRLLFYRHGLPWWGEGVFSCHQEKLEEEAKSIPSFVSMPRFRRKTVAERDKAPRCFFSISFKETPELKESRKLMKNVLQEKFGILCYDMEDVEQRTAEVNKLDAVIDEIKKADFVVMNVTPLVVNIMLELGICYAKKKPVYYIANKEKFGDLADYIRAPMILKYDLSSVKEGLEEAANKIGFSFKEGEYLFYKEFNSKLAKEKIKQEKKCLYLSHPPERKGLWFGFIQEIRKKAEEKGWKIITDEDAPLTWDFKEKGVYCICASARSLIDITYSKPNPIRSFLLGFSHAKRRPTWCCYEAGSQEVEYPSLWEGKPSFKWSDSRMILEHLDEIL